YPPAVQPGAPPGTGGTAPERGGADRLGGLPDCRGGAEHGRPDRLLHAQRSRPGAPGPVVRPADPLSAGAPDPAQRRPDDGPAAKNTTKQNTLHPQQPTQQNQIPQT